MAQIMVVEPDELVVTSLKKIFRDDNEIKLTFVENFNSAVEILNGNPKYKDAYEKLKAAYEGVKTELLEATQKEVTAKTARENTADLLLKYKTNLESLEKPEAAAVPPTEVKPTEPVKEIEEQKQNLKKEIERLSLEVKNQQSALVAATKTKSEKEKITQEKLNIAEEAKKKIPAANDEVYSVLVISSVLLTPTVAKWVENFSKIMTFESNKAIKIVVLGFEFDEKSVKKYLDPRISDYMIKPIDELLARQNIKSLASSDKKTKSEVYSLQIKEPVDLIFQYELESMSEFSFVISSQEKFETNEFRVFNCDLFLRKGQKSVLAKCLSSSDKPGGGFLSEFWFSGMDTHLAFQIRNVIKNAPKL